MYQARRYTAEYKLKWNEFLQEAKNGSFLFNRDFMEYHSDRFQDYSLMILEGENLVGIIPANLSANQVISHEGLTYGSVVVKRYTKLISVLEILFVALKYLAENNIRSILFKQIPRIYNEIPADEIDWALFILNAKLLRRDSTMSIDQQCRLPYQGRRKRGIRKAQKSESLIKTEGVTEYSHFWNDVLIPNMLEKHGVKPVHTLEEITKLAAHFPNNIKQYNIYVRNNLMAGCTMFLNKTVAHVQYISGSVEGRKNGYLDFLINHLIDVELADYRYFDFGICNEENGLKINYGLLDWKEGFGARAISQDFYQIETANYQILEQKIKLNE